MSSTFDNTALVAAAEEFLAAAKSFEGDDGARVDLMKQAYALRYHTEDARGMLFRHWEATHALSALETATVCGILQNIPRNGTASSKELAKATKLDESVVWRAMGILCVQGIGEEVSPRTYAHNEKSLSVITGNGQYFLKFITLFNGIYARYPEYFSTHAPQDVFNNRMTPYAYAMGKEGTRVYEVIGSDPVKAEIFNHTMSEIEGIVPTLGCYDFSIMKEQVQAEPDRPFIVDVGGSYGFGLMAIQEEAPAGFGAEMILQDRPDVIADIKDADIPNITKMAHDFFTPNPVKNAHLYFLRRVIHNFPDEDCKIILKQIAVSMGPTSRLLVGEFILPEKAEIGDDFTIRWMDWCMISIAGKERTQREFEELLDSAGLELVKVWPFVGKGYPQSMIEAQLKRV